MKMLTFDSHLKSKFWSSKNTLKPNEVALNSHKKFWFDCDCGHQFDIQLNNVNIGKWCPFCANKKLCSSTKKCKICFNKCFASVEYSENWSNKNEDLPEELFKNSHKEYLFDCPECKHTFKQKISRITRGNTCNYCHNLIMCSRDENCFSCVNKSFASVERSKNWSCKNKKKPIEVFKSSAEKFWFNCHKCKNEFESRASHITDGSWCPNCRYKTEDKLYKILSEKYPSLKTQYKVDWCKDKKHLPFDFVIEERKVIVEQDGVQHWKQVAKWKTPEHNRKRDLYKMKCANKNGFSVIRILQKDVFKNKYDWLSELCENIEKIINENKVQNIYMCKNNEYKDFDII
jgi:very-short-patch-repair endonuclease